MERTIEQIRKELDKANDEYSEHFDKAPPGMDLKEFFKYMEPMSQKCSKLSREYRMLKEPEFEEIPKYGDVFSLEHFIDNCNCGGFIDYDGFGQYARDGKMSNIEIRPSDIKNGAIRKDFDSVVWFNK